MVSVPCYKKGLLIVCFYCWKQKVYNSTSHSVKVSLWKTAGPLMIFEIWPLQFKIRHTFKVVLSTVSVLLKVAIDLQGNVTAVFKTMVRKTQTSQQGEWLEGKLGEAGSLNGGCHLSEPDVLTNQLLFSTTPQQYTNLHFSWGYFSYVVFYCC